jgi:hypothetical protein
MSGSRKDVNYVADNGDIYAIQVDESNIELVMGAQVPLATVSARKPSNLRTLRSVTLGNIDGTIRRNVPVLTAARYNEITTQLFELPVGDPDAGVNLVTYRKVPEKFVRLPRLVVDTGKNDGDLN